MAKKKNKLEQTLIQWAYQNKKCDTHAARCLKSLGEVEKTLNSDLFLCKKKRCK